MNGPAMIALARAWTALILREEKDPATWLLRIRHDAEALGLRPERCMTMPATVQHLTSEVMREAVAQGLKESAIREALRLPETS